MVARRVGVGMARLGARLGVAFAVFAAAAGCSGPGQYIWFDQLPQDKLPPRNEYVIDVGDVVNIRILGHDEMSVHQRVRSDGRIGILLIGDIEAKGKHPDALRAELEGRLKDYIVAPSIVVNIDEAQPVMVLLLGEVARQGGFALDRDVRLAHALALGGGLTEYASRDSIFVVRENPVMRIRFKYDAIVRNVGSAGDFQLQSGDVIEVE